MKLAVHIRRSSTGSAFQAFCPDLPGCSASARTEEQALRLLRRRVDDQLADSARRATPGTRIHIIEV